MNKAQNLNLSLLSQYEVDTLVEFLQENKDAVDSSVLNQRSVDKLIELLRYDNNRRKQEVISALPELEGSLANAVTVREDAGQVCEICFRVDEADGFIKILVRNTVNGKEMEITPAIVDSDDEVNWGRCISPIVFCRLASALDVKYTADTYEIVCRQYAECMFGDAKHKIPFLYLPSNAQMIQSLM